MLRIVVASLLVFTLNGTSTVAQGPKELTATYSDGKVEINYRVKVDKPSLLQASISSKLTWTQEFGKNAKITKLEVTKAEKPVVKAVVRTGTKSVTYDMDPMTGKILSSDE